MLRFYGKLLGMVILAVLVQKYVEYVILFKPPPPMPPMSAQQCYEMEIALGRIRPGEVPTTLRPRPWEHEDAIEDQWPTAFATATTPRDIRDECTGLPREGW